MIGTDCDDLSNTTIILEDLDCDGVLNEEDEDLMEMVF